ncbi:SMR family transporter [Paenibacillus lutrae]|uniref:QacE family quaternary ammonium compound efflux SMR transporter n=1 Tax=Paenibacillus lutrae TaxID=2078573 RepID=A0A7X3FFQ1_9BACL|nr:QacE family quaternary ammonium compound efflux SMR transporter [Paenibacillus lutrae]
MNKHWIYVLAAGFLEIGWVSGLKHADSALTWGMTALAILISFWVLLEATRRLPVGTVYAVFTGIGTAGTVIAETVFFQEPFSWLKVLFILILLGGVVGLKLTTTEPDNPEPAEGANR